MTRAADEPAPDRDVALLRAGRRAWAALGIAGVLVLLYLLLREVSLLVTPLVVALFPAAVLAPFAARLKRWRLPGALAALLLVLAVLAVIGLVLWFVVPRFAAELPALGDSVQEALGDLEDAVAGTPLSLPVDLGEDNLGSLAEQLGGVLGGDPGAIADQGLSVLQRTVDLGTAVLVFFVALFFYLRDGDRIWRGVTSLLPGRARQDVQRVAGQLWWTVGAYFRAQLLVALVDAVAIGLGLLLLDVPLVLPLALLVFFGGFFPIVGAFVSGLVAVLVALADQGLGTALLVLALVVAVQQAEGNLLEPLIISPVLRLHPFAVILSVTAGAVTYGVLGAFLAVPLAACTARVVDYLRGRRPAAGPGSSPEDGHPPWGDGHDADAAVEERGAP